MKQIKLLQILPIIYNLHTKYVTVGHEQQNRSECLNYKVERNPKGKDECFPETEESDRFLKVPLIHFKPHHMWDTFVKKGQISLTTARRARPQIASPTYFNKIINKHKVRPENAFCVEVGGSGGGAILISDMAQDRNWATSSFDVLIVYVCVYLIPRKRRLIDGTSET